jgi:TonB family protein
VIRLRGNLAGQNFVKEIPVELPESQTEHDSLATLWARTRIDDLMSQDYARIQNDDPQPDVREAITQLGLEYRLMTQFTSFVAVEEMTVTDGGQPRRIDVPVEMPEGMSREGVFGADGIDLQVKERGKQQVQINGGVSGYAGTFFDVRAGGRSSSPAAVPSPPPPPPPSKGVPPQIASMDLKVSRSVLQGGATRKVQPAYPAIAKAARAQGSVQVEVTISESGEVMNAQAISGHPMLREAALQAAKQWRFKPTELSGVPVKTQGVITFNFDSGKTATPSEDVPLTPLTEEQLKQQLRAKLHPAVAAVIERLKNKDAKPGADELKFTRDGKAEIQVWLLDKSAETIGQLKKLGFETLLDPQSSKLIIGRLPVEKLAALVELPAVRYIAPQTR